MHARIGLRFRRAEPRRRVREYLCGLVAQVDRKNGWTLAEHAGEVSPDGMQRLLRWALCESGGSPPVCGERWRGIRRAAASAAAAPDHSVRPIGVQLAAALTLADIAAGESHSLAVTTAGGVLVPGRRQPYGPAGS